MRISLKNVIACIGLIAVALLPTGCARAQGEEPRLALVIGNSQYPAMPLATAVNDAGLIAQTLQTAGFDVTAASDLDLESLRTAFRAFVDKAQQAGPNSVLFVYLAGRGVQYSGDNFFVPVDAVINRDTDIPIAALRLSDYMQALAGAPAKARIVVMDAARGNGFGKDDHTGGPLAGGLALVDPTPGSLYAFNATPDTIAPDEPGPYGVYARALVEMMQAGLPVNEVFARARLRVSELTRGTVVPWDQSRIEAPIYLFFREQGAQALPSLAPYEKRPLRDFSSAEAFALVVERDTISGYEEFLDTFPRDPLARRARILLAARREALSWWRAYAANTPRAYWSYMQRYPHGPHYWDARRRLLMLRAALEPPPRYEAYEFDGLPPPPEDEYRIVDRPVVVFDDDDYAPPPAFVLPPQPERFRQMAAPPPAPRGFVPAPAHAAAPDVKPAQRQGTLVQPNFGQRGGAPGHAEPGKAAEQSHPGSAAPAARGGAAASAAPIPQPATAPAPKPAAAPLPKPATASAVKPAEVPALKPPGAPAVRPASAPAPKPAEAPAPKPVAAPAAPAAKPALQGNPRPVEPPAQKQETQRAARPQPVEPLQSAPKPPAVAKQAPPRLEPPKQEPPKQPAAKPAPITPASAKPLPPPAPAAPKPLAAKPPAPPPPAPKHPVAKAAGKDDKDQKPDAK